MTKPNFIIPASDYQTNRFLRINLDFIWDAVNDSSTGFVTLDTAQDITGAKTFDSSKLLLEEAGGTDTATIAVASLAASRTYTVPDAGAAADFVMTEGAQTINGAKTFDSSALKLEEAGGTDVVTVAVAALGAGRTYTVPDAGGAATFGMVTAGGALIASGTYTPTVTSVANLDSSSAQECQYMRVGNTVTVSGIVTVDPTLTATSTQLGISIPIASNFAVNSDCSGVAFAYAIAGQGAAIVADGGNDRAHMQWISTDITSQDMVFTFSYQVI